MKFLDDYPTLEKLEATYPGITASTDKKPLTSTNNSYALTGVALNYLSRLQQRYSQSELLYGLRILFGVGKGTNRRYVALQNGVIVKYGADGSALSGTAQNRIASCVRLARSMVQDAWFKLAQALSSRNQPQQPNRGSVNFVLNPPQSVVAAALHEHFTIALDNANAVNYVINSYKKIHAGLSNHIIVAATDPDADGMDHGHVNLQKIVKHPILRIPSPFQTLGIYAGDEAKITRLQTDQNALNACARRYGVAPTIPALFTRRSGSIHIDFRLVENRGPRRWTDLGIATIIVHEASHKFDFTTDHAYCSEEDKYDALSASQLLRNADSYAFAAASIHCTKLITDEFDTAITAGHTTTITTTTTTGTNS